ncbi:two-component regulator propeller domain-containing protein [Bacteroidota bacterium]
MINFCKLIRLIILLVIFSFYSSYSQIPDYQRITDYDVSTLSSELNVKLKGLSHNDVHCMIQDSRGYMWFGTNDGLNRFDGLNFIVYSSDVNQENHFLRNSSIMRLYSDSDDYMWVGTKNGLYKFDHIYRKFEFYQSDIDDTQSLLNNSITSIIEDDSGYIWAGTFKGLNRINRNTGETKSYFFENNNSESISNDTINCLFIDHNEVLWIGTVNGLNKYDEEKDSFERLYRKDNLLNSIPYDFINSICEDDYNNLWIGTGGGIGVLDSTRQIFTNYYMDNNRYSLSSDIITSILKDRYGNIWIGTYGYGLNMYNREKDNFINYKNSNENIWGSNNNYILSLYEDNSGIIWVGYQYKGVKKIDPNTSKFRHHLPNNAIFSIWEYEPEIFWVGTDGGIFEYKALGQNENNKVGKGLYSIRDLKNNARLEIREKVTSILRDSKGFFWFGTFIGLVKYDHINGTALKYYTHDPEDPNSIADDKINHLFEDSKGTVWISTWNGLSSLHPDQENFNNYYISLDSTNIGGNDIYSIFEDSKNRLWVSTNNGLYLFNRETKAFQLLFSGSGGINDLSSKLISSIIEDNSGRLWIGTQGGGLSVFDENTGQFEYFSEEEGLADNMIFAILQDNETNLWISTGYGLSKFDRVSKKFTNYDIENGLQGMEFSPNSAYKSKSGELFFGGTNGFNSFFPKRIKENRYESPLLITSFKVFNEQQPDNFNSGDTLTLKHFENSFAFEFASLDYTHHYNDEFEYILDNFEQEWKHTTSSNREVNYAEVSPGFYTFRVRKTNIPEEYNDSEYILNLVIVPPWWTTTLFLISAIIVFILIVGVIINARFQMIKRSHEVEKQIIDSERKALLSQMNPHFVFNSLSSIQNFILKKDELSANRYLGDFSSLIRRILENSKLESIPLYEELETLKLYLCLEQMRFANSIKEKIQIDESIDLFTTKISPMLIQPYIENAILHGLMPKSKNRELSISINIHDNKRLLCTIEDNGIGREKSLKIRAKAKTHQSTGMKNIKDRIILYNKIHKTKMDVKITDLYDENNEASGTRVDLYIPYVFD